MREWSGARARRNPLCYRQDGARRLRTPPTQRRARDGAGACRPDRTEGPKSLREERNRFGAAPPSGRHGPAPSLRKITVDLLRALPGRHRLERPQGRLLRLELGQDALEVGELPLEARSLLLEQFVERVDAVLEPLGLLVERL